MFLLINDEPGVSVWFTRVSRILRMKGMKMEDEICAAGGEGGGRRLVAVLGLVIITFGLLHVVNRWLMNAVPVEQIVRWDLPDYRARFRLFHLDRESAVPAWFSTLLIAANAGLLFLLARAHRVAGLPGARRWGLAALCCLGLSADEAVSFHENLGPRVSHLLGQSGGTIEYYGWVVPGVLAAVVVAAAMGTAVWRLPRFARWGFIVAAGVYVMSAAGMETAAGLLMGVDGGRPSLQGPPVVYTVLLLVEECGEMLGMLILLWTLVRLMRPRVVVSSAGLTPAAADRATRDGAGAVAGWPG